MAEYRIILSPEQEEALLLRTAQYRVNTIAPTGWNPPSEDAQPPPWTPELLIQEIVDADLANTARQAEALKRDTALMTVLLAIQAEAPPSF